MPKDIEVREGDTLTIKVQVKITNENALGEQIVTLEVFGRRTTGLLKFLDLVKIEKGNGWPS